MVRGGGLLYQLGAVDFAGDPLSTPDQAKINKAIESYKSARLPILSMWRSQVSIKIALIHNSTQFGTNEDHNIHVLMA